jgi:hypothetical protein
MRKQLLILGMAGLSILPAQAHAWRGGGFGGGFHAGAGGFTSWHHAGWGGGGFGGAYHAGWGGATHVGYGGVTHVGYGGAYHAGYGGGAYYHPVYHPTYGGGCWGCTTGYSAGAVAAAGVVGLAAGAAIGSAAASPTVVVQQPVYVTGPAIGSEVFALPGSGCNSVSANGVRYYNCGDAYYRPHFGSNGVYYTVVANPF